ncbi:MAG: restriction endonuclease subunit S, partial [Veillonella sp.]|nr:restriction endonuclease subunit S [Veillonella sp.]
MSKEKRRVPKLRFPGFTEDWEQRKLSDILKVNSGKDYKHLEQGDIPVYGTGGYMLSVNESLSNIDAIGIGRKGTIDKPQYLKAPFWTVDTLFYLTALDKHSILFLYYLMQLMPWKKFDESTGVPSLSKTTIDNINGYVPSNPKEEELISTLFNQLDKSITLHQRKLNNLKLKKKALLQKLFPKNGKRYPELRFPGFTDAWEQRKLKYKRTELGDFIYSSNNLETGSIGINKTGKAVISPVYSIFYGVSIGDSQFIGIMSLLPRFIAKMIRFRQGVVYGQWRIHEKDFLDISILIPSEAERTKITKLILSIEELITLHQ